jgi:hypothetical protein
VASFYAGDRSPKSALSGTFDRHPQGAEMGSFRAGVSDRIGLAKRLVIAFQLLSDFAHATAVASFRAGACHAPNAG